LSDPAQRFDPASSEDFREAMAIVFGNESLEPARAKQAADTVTLDCIESSVGLLIAGATQDAVVQLEFSDRQTLERRLRTVRRRFTSPIVQGSNRWLQELTVQLSQYFAGERREFQLPLRYPGTAFQERVWDTLLEIPYGRTWSYLDMAVRIGDVKATRAVGSANGTNPIAIIIPCHRVINANGELGGYGGGLWRKRILLDLEMGQKGLF
jgi:AraC family transcriptional regulator of adaptative response/methylated-DNA-[protein]-cysteine methyltransferase